MASDDDGWDAFGSDEEEDEVENDTRNEIALFLSKFFLKRNPQIKLEDRVVGLIDPSGFARKALEQRGFTVLIENPEVSVLDALVMLESGENVDKLLSRLLPGGVLVVDQSSSVCEVDFLGPSFIEQTQYVSRVKLAVRAHTSTCPWLPSSFSKEAEQERLLEATITLSAHEVKSSSMTEASTSAAVAKIREFGYVVVRNLLNPDECQKWGKAVLESVHLAAKILLEKDQVDILNPHNSQNEPETYREMSMREDLRLDLRNGPPLSKLRSKNGDSDSPVVVSAATQGFNGFLRGHSDLLDIIRRTMNPKERSLFKGNIGRYNFDGSGPDGSYQDLRVSQVGGIVSFPGAADQAIHADIPHLFEHLECLPAHYINVFAPGVPFDDKVGGTAFFHGSHNLRFTAQHCGSSDDYQNVFPFLVRPSLTLGDVVLFDCRILHCGLDNRSDSIERVLLYTNATQKWFHDPKNFDDQRSIFSAS